MIPAYAVCEVILIIAGTRFLKPETDDWSLRRMEPVSEPSYQSLIAYHDWRLKYVNLYILVHFVRKALLAKRNPVIYLAL
jgi:hypothetical protein